MATPSAPTAAFKNLRQALRRWRIAGLPRPSRRLMATRLQHCRSCDNWRPSGYFGTGTCALCHCTRLKLWLPTEACPLPPPHQRWTAT